ncbi:hypothetical protein FHX69_0013 [Prauserella muralis]|nr:hypothetical protein FHX69_0013 [Prauserella muralis]
MIGDDQHEGAGRVVHLQPHWPEAGCVMDESVIHLLAYHSWWDGHVVGLCGAAAQAGQWEWVWISWGEKRCQECERVRDRGA